MAWNICVFVYFYGFILITTNSLNYIGIKYDGDARIRWPSFIVKLLVLQACVDYGNRLYVSAVLGRAAILISMIATLVSWPTLKFDSAVRNMIIEYFGYCTLILGAIYFPWYFIIAIKYVSDHEGEPIRVRDRISWYATWVRRYVIELQPIDVNKIYIYIAFADEKLFYDWFYRINSNIVKRIENPPLVKDDMQILNEIILAITKDSILEFKKKYSEGIVCQYKFITTTCDQNYTEEFKYTFDGVATNKVMEGELFEQWVQEEKTK